MIVACVGIIGLGLVGSALAERFLAAGLDVCGFDIDAEKTAALSQIGGMPMASSVDVAGQCERIILSLPTSDIAAQVLEEIAGELAGKLVLDTTTGEPETMARLGAWLTDHGADYVDATIAGSSTQVRRSEVIVMLGGSTAALARAEDLLRAFAAKWFHLGPVGSGARMKLVVNLVLGLNRAVLAEGLAFAKACGIDPAKALEVLMAGPAFSRVMETKGLKMLSGDFSPEARLAQHHKDVNLILDAAAKTGQTLPLSEVHEKLLRERMDAGDGNLDNSVILRVFDPSRRRPRRQKPTMMYRPLGKTGIAVSCVSFGAGPVSALMTSRDRFQEQIRTVQRAVELGINWFDTAATYGDGVSEESLGKAFDELGLIDRNIKRPPPWIASYFPTAYQRRSVPGTYLHVATKVRIPPDCVHDMRGYVLRSLEESLRRLRLPRVTLLQVHNSITALRGDLPTSLSPHDVLGTGGVLEGMLELKAAGLVEHLGLTGLGDPAALTAVLKSGQFVTVQAPYNLLNPSAGREIPPDFRESNLGNLFATCQALQIGVFAIRVYAGGALAGQPPSAHTLTTRFFPLDLYERDQARAAPLQRMLPKEMSLPEVALRFAIAHPGVASALVGFASPEQVEQAVAFADLGPLSTEAIDQLSAVVEEAGKSLP